MDIKGVCYDVGRAYSGYFLTRRVFDPTAVHPGHRPGEDGQPAPGEHPPASFYATH